MVLFCIFPFGVSGAFEIPVCYFVVFAGGGRKVESGAYCM